MALIQEYTDFEIAINARALTSFRLPLPQAVPTLVPSLVVSKSAYLNSIRGAIDYRSMPPTPEEGTAEVKKWFCSRLEVDGREYLICWWGQWLGDKSYVIGINLKAPPAWEYQNPPRDLERIEFVWASQAEPWAHPEDSIPDTIAEDSLAALPYMGIPAWAVPVLGAIGLGALVGLVWVATRK